MQIPNRLFQIGLLILMTGLTSGCNTISGIGEDLQAAGRAIENTAEDAQESND